MKPLIGLTSEFVPARLEGRPWHAHQLLVDYTTAVRVAGGVPVILPLAHPEIGPAMLERLDGLMLTGGCQDIPPETYGQQPHPTTDPMPVERWASETTWLDFALAAGTPVLGICLGMQAINVAMGGTLIQDLPSQAPHTHAHSAPSRMHQHDVTLAEGSWLASIAPAETVTITSAHHQAIDRIAIGLQPVAHSADGILEAVETPDRGIVAAVQWHPERNILQPDWLIQGFVRHCAARIEAAAR